MHWAGKRLHAPLNRTTLQALQLAEAGENYGSIVATCGATLLVEEKSSYGVARGQGEPEIDCHSIVLEQTEQTIAEIRGAPDTLCMMDYRARDQGRRTYHPPLRWVSKYMSRF